MNQLPIHKRKFFAFLSYAHADTKAVDQIESWLNEKAGVPIWYDSRNLPPGTPIGTYLPKAVAQCRNMFIILSNAAIQSGWVEEELNAAIGQRTQFREFRIIPVRIEECEIPSSLTTTKWIDAKEGKLNLENAKELLYSIYYDEIASQIAQSRDIYVSRSWRDRETKLPDYVCRLLREKGFRLIGDSKDQEGFGEGERVRSIISSCGGLVAILPDRGQGRTSKYILNEISIADELKLPRIIVAENSVKLSDDIAQSAIHMNKEEPASIKSQKELLENGIEMLDEEWSPPLRPHYVFWGTTFEQQHQEVNRLVKEIIQNVTAMPCIIGDEIREAQIQQSIKNKISGAFMVLADISEDNLNTSIEAGIAMGANIPLHLVAKYPRRKPPFMFRGQQVWHYEDDIELLAIVHKITYPYRRRMLNYEITQKLNF